MSRTTRRALLASTIALPLLAACSSGDPKPKGSTKPAANDVDEVGDDAGSEGAKAMPQGAFVAQSEAGAKYTVHIPGEPAPADIEAYRKATGQPEMGYVSIGVDNSAGTDTASPSDVIIVGEDGKQLDYTSVDVTFTDWGPTMFDDGPTDENDGYYYAFPDGKKISEDEYDTLERQGVELQNKYLADPLQSGAKQTRWYVGPKVPTKVLSVTVQDAMQQYPADPA